jgi:hypothetical protein
MFLENVTVRIMCVAYRIHLKCGVESEPRGGWASVPDIHKR